MLNYLPERLEPLYYKVKSKAVLRAAACAPIAHHRAIHVQQLPHRADGYLVREYHANVDVVRGRSRCVMRRLTTEAVESAALPLERVDDVERGDSLALGVLSVGDCVADDTLEKGLEDTTCLFVDHWRGC